MAEQRRYQLLLLFVFVMGLLLVRFGYPCPEIFSQRPGGAWICSDSIWGVVPEAVVEILHKIGEALIIATFLALIVDESAKRKLIKEFSLDISAHIIGRWLPEALRNHLHGYLEMRLVRTSWVIEYSIKKAKSDLIELDIVISDTMQNHSDKNQNYDFNFVQEDSICPKEMGTNEITLVEFPGEAPLKGDDLVRQVKRRNNEHSIHRSIELEPFVNSKRSYQFRIGATEYTRDSLSVFYADYPVMTAVLIVKYSECDFEVSMNLTFADKVPNPRKSTKDGISEITWDIKNPILPGQAFLLKWSAKPAPPIQTDQKASSTPDVVAVAGSSS
jgi:hypothetical protein